MSKAVHRLNNVLALEACPDENKSVQECTEFFRLDRSANSSNERIEGHWETKEPNTENRILSDAMLPVDMERVRFVMVGVRKRKIYGYISSLRVSQVSR